MPTARDRDRAMPGSVYEKVLSNAQEAKAHDSRLIGVTPMHDASSGEIFDDIIPVPVVEELLSPILTVIPLQTISPVGGDADIHRRFLWIKIQDFPSKGRVSRPP